MDWLDSPEAFEAHLATLPPEERLALVDHFWNLADNTPDPNMSAQIRGLLQNVNVNTAFEDTAPLPGPLLATLAAMRGAEVLGREDVQSWIGPLDNPSRLLGAIVSGQNPLDVWDDTLPAEERPPVLSEALVEKGVNDLLALVTEFLVPDVGPTDVAKMGAFIGGLPPVIIAEFLRRASPAQKAIFGDFIADWQTFHGTHKVFDAPHSDFATMGRSGAGHYMASGSRVADRRLHASEYGSIIRPDTPIFENPFVLGSQRGGAVHGSADTRVPAKPALGAMYVLRDNIARMADEYLAASPTRTMDGPGYRGFQESLEELDNYISRVEAGEPLSLSWQEFRSLVDRPMYTAERPRNLYTLASDALGYDGVISQHNNETVAFRPERTVIYDLPSAERRVETLGLTLDELMRIPGSR